MHAMKLRVQALRVALVSGARGALPLVGGRHNNVGVSLRERRATTQVMLGMSLRARWEATLVFSILCTNKQAAYSSNFKAPFHRESGGGGGVVMDVGRGRIMTSLHEVA